MYLCLSCMGMGFALFGATSALGLHGDLERTKIMEAIILGGTMYWFLTGTYIVIWADPSAGESIVGTQVLISSVAYQTSFLAKIRQVIVEKDSSPFFRPSLIVNLVNAFVWGAYGLALGDGIMSIIYLYSVLSNSLCIATTFWYPAVPKALPRVVTLDPQGDLTLYMEAETREDRVASMSRERSDSRASQISAYNSTQDLAYTRLGFMGVGALPTPQPGQGSELLMPSAGSIEPPEGTEVFQLEAAPDPEGLGMQLMYFRARALTNASILSNMFLMAESDREFSDVGSEGSTEAPTIPEQDFREPDIERGDDRFSFGVEMIGIDVEKGTALEGEDIPAVGTNPFDDPPPPVTTMHTSAAASASTTTATTNSTTIDTTAAVGGATAVGAAAPAAPSSSSTHDNLAHLNIPAPHSKSKLSRTDIKEEGSPVSMPTAMQESGGILQEMWANESDGGDHVAIPPPSALAVSLVDIPLDTTEEPQSPLRRPSGEDNPGLDDYFYK